MKRFFIFIIGTIIYTQVVSAQNFKQTINTDWLFHKGNLNIASQENKDIDWENVNIPHSWNDKDVMDDNYGYFRGTCWYKKTIFINPSWKDKDVIIYFEGANQVTEVFVNGKNAGKHIGGYTAFSFNITGLIFPADSGKGNEILIKVDNSRNEDIPPFSADFTFFGGIYRDVFLMADEKVHFDNSNYASQGVFLTTPLVSKDRAEIKLHGKVENTGTKIQYLKLVTVIYDALGENVRESSQSIKINPNTKIDFSQEIPSLSRPQLWSPDHPYLYRAVSRLIDTKTGKEYDSFSSALGLRWFNFDPEKGFFLNGESLKLVGANRHQDYKDLANALPDALHMRDMKLIKEMGGNFVRVSHYPQDPSVLEACDRLGILAMVETPEVNRITQTAAYEQNVMEMQKEMIRQNFNHPSIILWGYMNEILLEPRYQGGSAERIQYVKELAVMAQKMEDLTRREDPYRYTIIPAHGDFDLYHKAGLTAIPMVMGWNLYYGWYTGNLDGLDTFLEKHHKELPGKSLIITEYGADADRKLHTQNPEKFDKSMEYATIYHKHYLDAILNNSFVAGGVIWNLVEFSSEIRDESWPHMNYKGVMSWDRVPKDAYYLYQSKLSKVPVVSIASKDWKIRTGELDSDNLDTFSQEVEIFSNQARVQLFVNGKDLGIKSVNDASVKFQVSFADGKNILLATVPDSPGLTDFVVVNFQLQSPNLKSIKHPFSNIRISMGEKRQYADEELSQSWLPEHPFNKGGYGFIGGQVYKMPGNPLQPYGTKKLIKGTNLDPIYQTQRQGIEYFIFDVPDGEYELTLHFCEFVTGNNKAALAYNLNEKDQSETKANREFDVLVNGKIFLEKLSNENYLLPERAVAFKTRLTVTGGRGIDVEFKKKYGETILNAIELIKVF
jgi:beta-galactosidase